MAYEVSRRSFLKGAAALAVATAASGLLTACGGGKGDDGVTVGKYKVYFDKPEYGTSNLQGNYVKVPLKIECIKTDYLDTARKFSNTFSATVAGKSLTLTNGDEKINNMKKGDKYSYTPCFTAEDALFQKASSGAELVHLKIDLYDTTAEFEVNLNTASVKLIVVK